MASDADEWGQYPWSIAMFIPTWIVVLCNSESEMSRLTDRSHFTLAITFGQHTIPVILRMAVPSHSTASLSIRSPLPLQP